VSADLTIGDLAARTGLSAATLRMWEQRHGFPVPHRLESGHRRYDEDDVTAVARVRERQAAGIRLDVAIAEAVERAQREAEPAAPSVYAELRSRHPHLAAHRLSKSTLLALSWAIEDEFCAKADRPLLFGAFQRGRYFEHASDRWRELARVSRASFVMGDFSDLDDEAARTLPAQPVRVDLPEDAPMRREWAVICDSVELPVALTAFELPGQSRVADRDRVFESIWTIDPAAVRDASRVCARVAADNGHADAAAPVLYELAEPPRPGTTDLVAVTAMFNRMVSYVDRFGQGSR